jgi:hypothetical protein
MNRDGRAALSRRRSRERCHEQCLQIYQTRLAALPREQPTPAPNWLPGRRVAMRIRCQPTSRAGGAHHAPLAQLVKLPGIWRPDYAPFVVRAR